MKGKGKSIAVLVVFAAVLVLTAFTAFVGLGPTGTGSARNVRLGLDLSGGVAVTYRIKDENPTPEEISDTIYKLQKRVENYSTEALVYKEGDDCVSIEIPGETDAQAVLSDLGKPGSLKFELEDGTLVLDGSSVTSAEAGSQKDELGNAETVVFLEFDKDGAEKFEKATGEHVGEKILVVYDGETISAPTVNSKISGGKAVVTGMESVEEAKNLASFIRIGSLALELEETRSNVVGARLGEEALNKSLIAGAIGIVLVILLMVVVYRLAGAVAGACLLLYAAADLVLLNAFDVTLTLPGIAGIVLSVGMAVDANVVIFSRVREEIAAGASITGAVDAGYKKSTSAIVDGNVTTLLAAAVLGLLGTGTVKGFAQTLAIGVCLSMVLALLVSKPVLKALIALGFSDEKWFGRARKTKTMRIVEKRAVSFAIAIVAVLSGFVAMGVRTAGGSSPLNLSMDFKGGTNAVVELKDDMTLAEIEKNVKPIFEKTTNDGEVQIQKVAGTNSVSFKTRTLSNEERTAVENDLRESGLATDAEIEFETITASVSSEMKRDAVMATVVAILLMLAYIWIRFMDFRFALASVTALIHDALVTFACYAIVGIPLGGTFIACMLTILGYSINASIVVFDRTRENLKRMNGATDAAIADESVTQTLTRSLYSTLTTFMTIAVLFVLGVPTIREFSLPLMVGIVAGCFSSVCLAAPIWELLRKAEIK